MNMIWMQSLEGSAFDLLHPTPDMINWRTVSIILARVPRFGGHTLQGLYSVAQHSVEGARAILRDTGRRDWAAAFLLHDVHEAYIGDIITPVAKALEACATEEAGDDWAGAAINRALKELKRRIDVAVYAKAGIPFPTGETAAIIKEYDYRMAATERGARLAPYPTPWHHTIESRKPLQGCDLTPWGEPLASVLFKSCLLELLPTAPVPVPQEECGCCDPNAGRTSFGVTMQTYEKQKEPIWR